MRRPGLLRKLPGPRREIVLRCRMAEKLLERIREEGVRVAQAGRGEEYALRLIVRDKDAQKVRMLAEKYSVRIVSERAVGPDLRALAGRALPFAAGFAAVLFLFVHAVGFIWRIDVRCPEGGEPEWVQAAIAEAGVRIGDAFPQEDPLARELESLCPGYAHISVRRDGIVLLVEAYRETDAPEVYDVQAARDLVAKYDAVVEEVKVLAGRAAVQPGDVVKKGQALILGEEQATDETTRGVRALGEATGLVWAWAEAQAPCAQEKAQPTGNERMRASVKLLEWEWPIRRAEDFALQEVRTERIDIGGVFLPLHIERQILQETELKSESIPLEGLVAALEAKTMAEAMAKLPQNAQIIDKWTDYSMMEGEWLAFRLCLQARLPIAAARDEPDMQ
ncbi:MAG: sporulation protein YqfD [Clostridia bacterium]|nr:sporulation protein YqfD [Clostridia bacterium]